MNIIERFIAPFRNPDTIHLFTEGYCYYFAKILQMRFTYPDYTPDIYYNPIDCHFACLIYGELWDINGPVCDDIIERGINQYKNWYKWTYYMEVEPLDAARVKWNCILKTY
jgi:hypothetical protein